MLLGLLSEIVLKVLEIPTFTGLLMDAPFLVSDQITSNLDYTRLEYIF